MMWKVRFSDSSGGMQDFEMEEEALKESTSGNRETTLSQMSLLRQLGDGYTWLLFLQNPSVEEFVASLSQQ
jgi:hypothetical protein